MKIICRCAIVFGVVVAAWSVSGQVGFGQKRQPGQPAQPGAGTGTAAGLSSVKMIEDPNQRKRIEVGGDLIRDKVWNDAVKVLQGVLDEKKDYYVQVRERDPLDVKKENIRWTSVKFEANNLIGSMDPEGLQTYEQVYGADAKAILDEAKKNGDRATAFRGGPPILPHQGRDRGQRNRGDPLAAARAGVRGGAGLRKAAADDRRSGPS